MLFKFCIFFFICNLLQAQYTNLEEIADNKPFTLTEAEFIKKYVEKYKINWRGGFSGGSKDKAKIYGFDTGSVNFRFSKKKLDTITLDLSNSFNNMGFQYWSQKNHEVLKKLTAKYGKTKKVEIRGDLSIVATWETPTVNLLFLGKAINSPISYNHRSRIIFHKNSYPPPRSSEKYTIPGEILNAVKNTLYNSFSDKLPTENESATILRILKRIKPPKILVNQSHKLFYGHSNMYREPEIKPLELFYAPALKSFYTKDKVPFQSGFVEVITENSKIIALHNISKTKEDKKEVINVRTSYIYDKGKALKIIHAENGKNIHQYWIDYDENGFLSRVFEVLNHQLKNVYFIHTNNQYKNYVALQYSYAYQKFMNFKAKIDPENISYSFNDYYRGFRFNASSGSSLSILSLTEKCKENNVMPIIPNIETLGEYKPDKAVDSSFLLPVINQLKASIALSKKHNEDIKKKSQEILNGNGNPFVKMDMSIVYKVGEIRNNLPFVINKVAEKAIQIKTSRGKLITVFKDKTILKYLKLVEIDKDGAKFKNLSSGRILFMQIGKPHSLDKSILVSFKNKTHKLSNDDTFMGYKVLVENDEAAFSKGNNLFRQKGFYFELPNLVEIEGRHKIHNCRCYTSPSEATMQVMTPKEITHAKIAKIDEKYIATYCDIELFKVTEKRTGASSSSFSGGKIGIFTIRNNTVAPIELEVDSLDYKLDYRNGKFSVNGKSLRFYTDSFKKSAYMADVGKKYPCRNKNDPPKSLDFRKNS